MRQTIPLLILLAAGAARADGQPTGTIGYGSYGRMALGTDLRGQSPSATNVVEHGPRVVESPYAEIDLYYRPPSRYGIDVKTVTTLALLGEPFHYSGNFDAKLALRNLYAEARFPCGFSTWVGSRMYRGDDIYLLDYWPLDNRNTVGGGLGLDKGQWEVAAHAGASRSLNGYQYQVESVAAPTTGATDVVTLDRQRFVASLKGRYRFYGDGKGLSAQVKALADLEGIAAGIRTLPDDTLEQLPADSGYSLGLQLGVWGFAERSSHVNLFLRRSAGLAAYGESSEPFGFDAAKKLGGAAETVLGVSGNYEQKKLGVQVGGYARWFHDADGAADRDDGPEWVLDARPYVEVLPVVQVALDLSYQARFPEGDSPTTLGPTEAGVFQIAPMLLLTPGGTGSYERPQLRIVYRYAHLNDGALDLYAVDDPRRAHPDVHYIGAQVEWWFNSSYR